MFYWHLSLSKWQRFHKPKKLCKNSDSFLMSYQWNKRCVQLFHFFLDTLVYFRPIHCLLSMCYNRSKVSFRNRLETAGLGHIFPKQFRLNNSMLTKPSIEFCCSDARVELPWIPIDENRLSIDGKSILDSFSNLVFWKLFNQFFTDCVNFWAHLVVPVASMGAQPGCVGQLSTWLTEQRDQKNKHRRVWTSAVFNSLWSALRYPNIQPSLFNSKNSTG